MDIRNKLHNLKTMVLNESHISETSKEKIANRIFEIEKSVAINYTPCCKSDSELLVCDDNELDCPYAFTSRCTMGRCGCKPKAN